MFTMDVPAVPAQETPIVLAQAAAPGTGSATSQPDYLLTTCKQTESTGDPSSAFHAVDPAYMLKNFLYVNSKSKIIADLASIKTTLQEGTAHGKITTEIDNEGNTFYGYDPIPNYVGKDKVVFMAEFEGKHYRIVVNLVVSLTVGESPLLPGEEPVCPPPTLIRVNGKPVSGSATDIPTTSSNLSSWLSLAQLDGAMADASGITVTVADLAGAAVGQTTGTSITLDTNAAGNGWFIDTTPADNSEFLPTADPNVWMAKADSAAAGKMDMLSVLLHEYGHALGIEHSADPNDFMNATLQAGEHQR